MAHPDRSAKDEFSVHPNDLTPKEKFEGIRTGLAGLGKHPEDNAAQIRDERKKRGLPNRG